MTDYRAFATACVGALQGWYNNNSGLWDSTNWWNAANALEAIIDYASLNKTNRFNSVIANTFEKNKARVVSGNILGNFRSQHYDDQLWWALTWVKAYDFTRAHQYLDKAATIFHDTTFAWDSICGGGVWWDRTHDFKNAITNELFVTLAARLYIRRRQNDYLTWTNKAWTWFQNSGLLDTQKKVVCDRLGQNTCEVGDRTTWTYNQGVILGAVVETCEITRVQDPHGKGNFQNLALAQAIADAAVTTLVDNNGILTEPCEADNGCGNDGPQFKGIFMRYLGYLYRILEQESQNSPDIERYKAFITKNADSIWQRNRTSDNRFGLKWAGPIDKTDAARQTSALDAFNTATIVSTS